IMLAEPEEKDVLGIKGSVLAGPFGLFTGFTIFIGLATLGYKTNWGCASRMTGINIKELGYALLTSHSMVFELISIVLLLAIIGALVLARKGRN
ncbi:MAG: NADH-quinone oxidoreductase subunit J, partial [Desulfobulbaceae bacterium]|nr:NADH-quinone oxidoreductase subunit J [Desulfobulbaceae bacterium]